MASDTICEDIEVHIFFILSLLVILHIYIQIYLFVS